MPTVSVLELDRCFCDCGCHALRFHACPRLLQPGEDAREGRFLWVAWIRCTQSTWLALAWCWVALQAAPLRKALNDSGLGEALIGGGLSDELRQPVFSIGLKGCDPANAAKVGIVRAEP
jgi:hypothetical protein